MKSATIRRFMAVIVLAAVATQAGAAWHSKKRITVREYVKRFVVQALDQLGCPPG